MRRLIVLLCLAAAAVLPPSSATAMTRASAAAEGVDWSGQWSTTHGPMRLTQEGNKVTGVYNYDTHKSEIRATASGRRLTGVWDERPAECDTGPIDWTMSEDGASFSGTWGPGCGSGGKWKGTRTVVPSLSVSVKAEEAGPTLPDADSVVTVAVKNTGTVPIEAVTVNNSTTIKVIKRSCPGAVLRTGQLENGGQGTIAPGETGSPTAFFKLTHVCAGSADVTVTVSGRTADGREVTGRGTARVVVRETARIRGTIKPVPAWAARPYEERELRSDEVAKLRRGITVRAKGPKRTLSARVSAAGTYEIEVPRNALGRYVVTTSAPKATELRPGRKVVTLGPGETAVRDYETGYSCETKLPGRGFAVKGGTFQFNARYRCRSRRMLVYVPLLPRPRQEGSYYVTTCTRADGSTYEVATNDEVVETLLEMGTDGVLRAPESIGWGNTFVTATFPSPAAVDVHVDSDCLKDQDNHLPRLS